jgi:hypothetical protein
MPLVSHPFCCDRPSNVWGNVHIMKLSCWPERCRTEECLVSVERMQSTVMHGGANCLGVVINNNNNNNNNLRQDNPSQSLGLNLGPSDTKQESSPTLFTRYNYYSRATIKDANHFSVKFEVLFILNDRFGLLIFLQSFPLRFLISYNCAVLSTFADVILTFNELLLDFSKT